MAEWVPSTWSETVLVWAKHVAAFRRPQRHLYFYQPIHTHISNCISGVARGGQGGHGPRAQALEGAPAQLVGANFKKKIRPRQIRSPWVSLLFPFSCWSPFSLLFFFAGRFWLSQGRMQDLPNGGGADPSIGPRALETLATPLNCIQLF